VQLTAD